MVAEDGGSEVISTSEALARADRAELDLVEIVYNVKLPVCKIIDFGKWRFEEKIKKKQEQKNQKSVAPKEIQLRYCIEQNDIETKIRSLKKFLEEKRQVRLIVKFKNRELPFKYMGEAVLDQMVKAVTDVGEFQNKRMEGKNLVVNLLPK